MNMFDTQATEDPALVLFTKYVTKIEGMIPDLVCDMPEKDHNDSVYDYACDYMSDREPESTTHEAIGEAAQKLADYFIG